eukprot:scaffold110440_cov31-Tisochrysis_lutea.AAC.3
MCRTADAELDSMTAAWSSRAESSTCAARVCSCADLTSAATPGAASLRLRAMSPTVTSMSAAWSWSLVRSTEMRTSSGSSDSSARRLRFTHAIGEKPAEPKAIGASAITRARRAADTPSSCLVQKYLCEKGLQVPMCLGAMVLK